MPGQVGRWRGKRHPHRINHRARHRVVGEPYRNRVQTRAHLIRNLRRFGQNNGQRPRPKTICQFFCAFRHLSDQLIDLFKVADVYNQRIVHRAPLCSKNFSNRRSIQRICRQAIDRLCRNPHQSAVLQNRCYSLDRARCIRL